MLSLILVIFHLTVHLITKSKKQFGGYSFKLFLEQFNLKFLLQLIFLATMLLVTIAFCFLTIWHFHGWAHPGICPPRPCPCSYTIMYSTVMYVFGSVDPRRKLVPVRRWTGGMSIFSSMTLCRIRAQLRDGSSLFGNCWKSYCFTLRFPATSSLISFGYLREWRRVVIADS